MTLGGNEVDQRPSDLTSFDQFMGQGCVISLVFVTLVVTCIAFSIGQKYPTLIDPSEPWLLWSMALATLLIYIMTPRQHSKKTKILSLCVISHLVVLFVLLARLFWFFLAYAASV